MNAIKKQIGIVAVLVLGVLACTIANARIIVMTFDHLNPEGEYVDNYYNGGCGGSYGHGVTCGGPDYGVVFAQAVAAGAPFGIFVPDQPGMPNTIGFQDNANAYMNVAAGFDTGFSFYYSACRGPGSIDVTSGLNGSGTLLATLALPVNGPNCNSDPNDYSTWTAVGVSFFGTARSVSFDSESVFYNIVYDNLTLGSAVPVNPVPEPAALGMFGLGVLMIGGVAVARRRRPLEA